MKKVFINIGRAAIKVLVFIVVFCSGFLFFGSNYMKHAYGNVALDSVIFTMTNPLKGTGGGAVREFISNCIIPPVIFAGAGTVLFILFTRKVAKIKYIKEDDENEENAEITEGETGVNTYSETIAVVNKRKKAIKSAYSASAFVVIFLIFAASFNYAEKRIDIFDYIEKTQEESTFIEQNYVAPDGVNLTFPEQKRNLIYIFLESMETSYMSEELGGANIKNYIPHMTELAAKNLHFSNSDNFGGAVAVHGTGWTVAAMIAQTSGLPFKPNYEPSDRMKLFESFFPNMNNIGDILGEAGYNQMLMVGSDADYAGRKQYFEQHGNYIIKDLFTAREDNIIDDKYKVWWGYEDEYLYNYAKQEITGLSRKSEPFNFTMLTVDTHRPSGYVCMQCPEFDQNGDEFPGQYEQVISCADRQLYDFVNWIQQQDFYENTTIVISGDHLTMENDYMLTVDNRTIFNTIINSAAETPFLNTKNRTFTVMDFFPTTLAALGVKIEGERLALGTNLFADDVMTLPELFGIEFFNDEITKKSVFYNENLLK